LQRLVTHTSNRFETLPAEVAACPLCGGQATLAFSARDRNRAVSPMPFRYRECRQCAALSLVDVPRKLDAFYPDDYYDLPRREDLPRVAAGEAHKLELIGRHAARGRLIEIGPGFGAFAFAARAAGYDVTGIEMDGECCRFLRETVGVDAVHSDQPADALAAVPSSRVIVLWHVLEHLADPWGVIDAAAANLEPGGVLALATPNPESLQLRVLGARWAHVDAPRHLYLIPLDALTRRAAASGLRLAEATFTDPAGRHWNRFGWERAVGRKPITGPTPAPVAMIGLGVALAMRPLEHRGRNGTAYTALFTKEIS
jgi:SAM-dependent methyltransferase